jgi:hypothetical protein
MIEFWIAQAIGFVVCLIATHGYFRKTREKFLGSQIIINVLYCVEYALLGVWSAVVSNVLSTVKFISFEQDAKKGIKTSLKKSLFFCALSIIFGIAVFDGWLSLVPVLSAVMITFATAQENPIVLRVMFAAVNVMWIVFNFISKAYVSCVYSAVDLVVSVVSMIVLLRRGSASLKDETKIKVEQNA